MGACQGAAVPLLDLILVEQGVEAPCQGEQEGAWASEAFLDACFQGGMVVAQVEVHLQRPVGLVPLQMEACPCWEACLEASIQEEEQEGNLEVACLAWALLFPEQ